MGREALTQRIEFLRSKGDGCIQAGRQECDLGCAESTSHSGNKRAITCCHRTHQFGLLSRQLEQWLQPIHDRNTRAQNPSAFDGVYAGDGDAQAVGQFCLCLPGRGPVRMHQRAEAKQRGLRLA